ncbi:UNVERIFIED_CONTAM: hypothetical protein Sangu_2750700 [Sesamum angustifolium]|uniref:DUF4218 domain-containing protein n=1 Tax=Sesamum angustifolium TaxID=2727405 RepID=A0AAW2IVZ5_9LAMI
MLPEHVWSALTEVSLLFHSICSTTLDVHKLHELKNSVTIILCNLAKIFPPAFFDSMEHLSVHLQYEARVGRPVQYSIPRRNNERTSINDGIQVSILNYPGRASDTTKKRWLNRPKRHIIEMYILTNCKVFTPYYEYNFQTERHNTGKSTMNCEVCVKSSSYTDEENDFYGIIEEIIQLTYPFIPNLNIILLKCHWVDLVRDMKVQLRYHLVDVNFKKLYQKDGLLVLAQQAVQVYFTKYPSMKMKKADWMVICKIKAQRVVDESKWTETFAYQSEKVVTIPAAGTSRRQAREFDDENEDEDENSGEDDETDDDEYEAT